jgi:hypothetical protein
MASASASAMIGRGVVLVDEAEGLGDEALGHHVLDALDREAAPARVLGERSMSLGRELAGLLRDHEPHRPQVRLGAPCFRPQVGRGFGDDGRRPRRHLGAHAGPQRQRVAPESGFGEIAGERLDPLARGGHVLPELLGAVELGGHVQLAEHIDHAHHRVADHDRQRRLAEEQRHRVPSGLTQEHRLGPDLGVDVERDLRFDPSPSLHLLQAREHAVDDGVVGVGVLRAFALDEAGVGGERIGALGRRAALDAVQEHDAGDHGLELATVAGDEAVHVLGRIAGRQCGTPARQVLVEDGGGGHGEVLIGVVDSAAAARAPAQMASA